MTTDLRDQLTRLASDLREQPDAFRRLSDFRRRRMRRRRASTLMLAVVVAASSTALLLRAFDAAPREGGTDTSPTREPALLSETYTDEFGWSVDFPQGWHVLPIDHFTGRFSLKGAAFSNEPLIPADDEGFGGDPLPDLSALSHDAVVMIVTHRSGGPAPTFGDDSEFPLDPAGAQGIPGPSPASMVLDFRGDGVGDFTVQFGGYADAPSGLFDALDRMIRTIRFEPWEPGEVRNGFAAVSTEIPEGMGEVNWVKDLELIYVLHIDGHLYALDVPDVSCEGQIQTWDSATGQILLEGPCYDDIRYDAHGVPDPANPPGYRTRLERHPIVRAWDGTSLVALGWTVSS